MITNMLLTLHPKSRATPLLKTVRHGNNIERDNILKIRLVEALCGEMPKALESIF
jgi:hypothetical protein